MVYSSIWRDTYYTTPNSPFNYTIRLDGEVIFAGRAYAFPGANEAKIKVNTVCENYLSQNELTYADFIDPADVSAVTANPNLVRYFELWDEDSDTLAETYAFLDCWDYDFNFTSMPRVVLSDPIDDTVIPLMMQYETRMYARLTDSEGKLVFAIDINQIKEWAAMGNPFAQVVFVLSGVGLYAEAGKFYYTPATDYLSFGSTVDGVEYQRNVMDFTKNWSDSEEDPMACGLHMRRFDNMLYCYSEDDYTEGIFTWASGSTTFEEDIFPTNGLSITTGGTYFILSQPHTYEAKTVIRAVDEDDPRVNNKCLDYVLYYVNARGGWDQFVIQGAVKKRDNITVYSTDRPRNNTTLEFEQMRNVTEIQTIYELNTHFLSDEQSEKLAKHLLGSNLVYLHCLKDGSVRPVTIQDKDITYQTYQTNGNKLAQYKITVAESQIKHRKH